MVGIGLLEIVADESLDTFAMPLNLPLYLIETLFGWNVSKFMIDGGIELSDVLVIIYVIVFNCFLYGSLFYILISMFARRKDSSEPQVNLPPQPPTF